MRPYRYLAALVAAALLAAVPAQSLAWTCTRPTQIASDYTKTTLTMGPGVYIRGIHATVSSLNPSPFVVGITQPSTIGIWMDDSTSGNAAWMGIFQNSQERWGYLYVKNEAGTTTYDTEWGPVSASSHELEITLHATGSLDFYHDGFHIGPTYVPLNIWPNRPGTVGATAGTNNRRSMMWGTNSNRFHVLSLKYSSQYGTNVAFPSAAVASTSSSVRYGVVEPGNDKLDVWDKNCT